MAGSSHVCLSASEYKYVTCQLCGILHSTKTFLCTLLQKVSDDYIAEYLATKPGTMTAAEPQQQHTEEEVQHGWLAFKLMCAGVAIAFMNFALGAPGTLGITVSPHST